MFLVTWDNEFKIEWYMYVGKYVGSLFYNKYVWIKILGGLGGI